LPRDVKKLQCKIYCDKKLQCKIYFDNFFTRIKRFFS